MKGWRRYSTWCSRMAPSTPCSSPRSPTAAASRGGRFRAAAARPRQARVRHQHVPRRQLYAHPSAVLPRHRPHRFPRARVRRFRRARGRAALGPQAGHEDDLLVRGRVAARRATRGGGAGGAVRRRRTRSRSASTTRTTATGCWARWRIMRGRMRSTASCGVRSARARSQTCCAGRTRAR